MSINATELLAVQLGLFQFRSPFRGRTVVVFCADSTAVRSLRKGGAPGLLSSTPWLRRSCARWSLSPSACLPSSFRAPTPSLTDSLSRPHQLTHPEWSLHMTVFLFLRRLWPVQMFSLPPRPLIVVQFTSPLSGFRGRQARTRFSSSGTAFGLTRSLRWLSSAYYRGAPGIHGDGTHSCDSPLG